MREGKILTKEENEKGWLKDREMVFQIHPDGSVSAINNEAEDKRKSFESLIWNNEFYK